MVVVSLFDGLSGARVALARLKYKVSKYYSSEIDKYAIEIANKNFPQDKSCRLGDVTRVDFKSLREEINRDFPNTPILLIGGSPCQSFSTVGNRKGLSIQGEDITSYDKYLEAKSKGIEFDAQSILFFEYARAIQELQPDYFLLENVRVGKKWETIINKIVGAKPLKINSEVYSAQSRLRYYWTNIPYSDEYENKDLHLFRDVIEHPQKFRSIKGMKFLDGMWGDKKRSEKIKRIIDLKKSPTLTTKNVHTTMYFFNEDRTRIRNLTPNEYERLQGLPDDYTRGVSNTQRFKMVGNGFQVTTVANILKYLPPFRLQRLEGEARNILLRAKRSKRGSSLSFSGGADSTIMHYINKKFNIGVNTIFVNSAVENIYNKKVIKKIEGDYKEVIKPKTRSYKQVVFEYGFPIQNKNFSELCYRVYRKRISINNVVDKFRVITGYSPYNTKAKNAELYRLEDRYWYLALNYPIQSYCCSILKKQPAKKIGKDNIIGIMKSDSPARRKVISLNFHGSYFPLKNWKKADVFEYAKKEGIELSNIYKDRDIERDGGKITLCGSTNSGCPQCDFGQNENHFIIKNGKKVKSTKFHILSLEFPKLYKATMEMKHKTGISFKEVIKIHRDSKKGKYLEESIKLRSDYAKEVKRFLKLKGDIPKEAFDLLETYIIPQ